MKLLFNFAGLLDRPDPHLPAVHGAGAHRRHPEHPARRGGRRAGAGRLVGQRVPPGHAAAVGARDPLGLDPRLRPHHQRAGDPAPARRADLPGDVHADLRRVPRSASTGRRAPRSPCCSRPWCWRWSTSRAASRGGRGRARDGGPGAHVAPAGVGRPGHRLPDAAGGGDRARLAQPHLVPDRAAPGPDAALVRRGARRPRVRARHRLQRGAGARRDGRVARRRGGRVLRAAPAPGGRRRRRRRAAQRAARLPRRGRGGGPAAVLRDGPR